MPPTPIPSFNFTGDSMSSKWWYPSGFPKAVVQIIHGMCEHIGRYDNFAKALVQQGYAVFACDLPGHGRDCPHLGYAEGDMWTSSLEQIRVSAAEIKQTFPGLPCAIFGHSYGSYLLQRLIPELDANAFILSGSCRQQDTVRLRLLWEKTLSSPWDKPADDLAALSFEAYNNYFPGEGKNAWLTRDLAQVEKYNADPLCGFIASYNFYRGMYHGLIELCDPAFPPEVSKPKPILLISGKEDPVGRFGDGVTALADLYTQKAYSVQLVLYENARHEVLNEENRGEVYACILNFLNRTMIR